MFEPPTTLQAIREWHQIDRARFENEVLPANEPAILRGVVSHWPVVERGRASALEFARYLAQFDNGTPVNAVMTAPEQEGRIHYDASMAGFNFMRTQRPVTEVLEQVLRYAHFDSAPAVAVQSALLASCLPGFAESNSLPLLDAAVLPRLWVGTAITTPAHFDESHNIACCVAGRREFTVLPTHQIANLYIGPLDHAPAGTPMSLVDFHKPDFERFPRFREALQHSLSAELSPGDAIYIPPLWWHNVRSLERINGLVNYWWASGAPGHATPPVGFDSLLHAVTALRGLPISQRRAWREVFEHYIFDITRDVTGHIPQERQSLLGPMTAAQHEQVRAALLERLKR